ncbi:hypothetical protein LP420_15950 [Massilia sp. B-10]|nr:hypothetical protein LP420_15950 [Massilia sp. B-10]
MSADGLHWIALHAHVGKHEDGLLRDVVAPLLAAVPVAPERFFFLRYWSGGPHLRLRFLCAPDAAPALRAAFAARFAAWAATVGDWGDTPAPGRQRPPGQPGRGRGRSVDHAPGAAGRAVCAGAGQIRRPAGRAHGRAPVGREHAAGAGRQRQGDAARDGAPDG